MALLPIVMRELRVASRRKSTYRFRLGVAVGALGIAAWIMMFPDMRSPRVLGMAMFIALSVVAFAECFLAGIVAASDCISEEKREGTLGLLFLTDLKGYDIVFGKLAATSLHAVYGLLAILPIMAIPLLAGGVSGAEFGRVVMAALNGMFFSLAAGVLASALCRDERAAASLAFLFVLAFGALLPVIGGFIVKWQPVSAFIPFLVFSPGYSAVMAFDTYFGVMTARKFNFFYTSLACVHACGWIFLVLATVLVPRSWQDTAAAKKTWRQRLEQLRYGTAALRASFRSRALAINPMYWLASRDRFNTGMIWGTMVLGALVWIWGLIRFGEDFRHEASYIITALLLHTVLKLWMASEAAKRFAHDRKSGALELILSTSLAVPRILKGQLIALWRRIAAPLAIVLVLDLIFLLSGPGESFWVILWIVGMVSLVGDLVALSWAGMWAGLCSRHTNRASAMAVSQIMVLPWIAFFLSATIGAFLDFPSWMEGEFVPVCWLALSIAANVVFGNYARRRLLADFRTVATERFAPAKSWFARLPSREPART